MSKKKTIVFVEGNISSGKSTLLHNLEEKGLTVFQEPIDVWKEKYKGRNGKNIFGLFYEDMARWSFQFEVAVMNTRYHKILDALNSDSDITIIERSLMTDMKVFAPNLYEMGKIIDVEWIIYNDWHNTFIQLVNDKLKNVNIEYIYVRTSPETCFERKSKRDRNEEKDVIPDYFIALHEKHENWLIQSEMENVVHTISGESNAEQVYQEVLNVLGIVSE